MCQIVYLSFINLSTADGSRDLSDQCFADLGGGASDYASGLLAEAKSVYVTWSSRQSLCLSLLCLIFIALCTVSPLLYLWYSRTCGALVTAMTDCLTNLQTQSKVCKTGRHQSNIMTSFSSSWDDRMISSWNSIYLTRQLHAQPIHVDRMQRLKAIIIHKLIFGISFETVQTNLAIAL